jgi:hypothetical protein
MFLLRCVQLAMKTHTICLCTKIEVVGYWAFIIALIRKNIHVLAFSKIKFVECIHY